MLRDIRNRGLFVRLLVNQSTNWSTNCSFSALLLVDQMIILVDELIDHAVEVSVSRGPMYFFHPLAGREDVRQMTDTFMEARASLTDHAVRLKAAMKIILVMSAKQIVVSYRRILMEQAERLEAGEEADTVALETCQRCLEVTERVAEMAVIYLKRATQNVFDSSVHDVKITLGKLSDDLENKEIQAISRL